MTGKIKILIFQMTPSSLPMDQNIEDWVSLVVAFITKLWIKNKFCHLANTIVWYSKLRCMLS